MYISIHALGYGRWHIYTACVNFHLRFLTWTILQSWAEETLHTMDHVTTGFRGPVLTQPTVSPCAWIQATWGKGLFRLTADRHCKWEVGLNLARSWSRSHRHADYWPTPPACWATLLIQLRSPCSGVALLSGQDSHIHYTWRKQQLHKLAYWSIWWSQQFFNWGSSSKMILPCFS